MMTRKPILASFIFAVLMVIASLALKHAAALRLVSGDMPLRGFQILMGLMIAFFGNTIPKNLPRFREGMSGRVQALQRTSGWLLTVAGLGYAAIWALVPLSEAANWSVAAVGAATGTVAVYAVWTHLACRTASRSPG